MIAGGRAALKTLMGGGCGDCLLRPTRCMMARPRQVETGENGKLSMLGPGPDCPMSGEEKG